MHRPAFFGPGSTHTSRMAEKPPSASNAWNSFDQPRSNSQAVVPHLVPATGSSSRRWSMATQSVGNASISSSCGGHQQPREKEVLEKQASIQSQVPPETMAALVANTSANPSGEGRKISFVLQQDNENESRTSSQTTLAMQVQWNCRIKRHFTISVSSSLFFTKICILYKGRWNSKWGCKWQRELSCLGSDGLGGISTPQLPPPHLTYMCTPYWVTPFPLPLKSVHMYAWQIIESKIPTYIAATLYPPSSCRCFLNLKWRIAHEKNKVSAPLTTHPCTTQFLHCFCEQNTSLSRKRSAT